MADYQNPTPVVVGIIPVNMPDHRGVLMIRRGNEPGKGKLALPGGFLEMEEWRVGLSREIVEETGVTIDPNSWRPFGVYSTSPMPNRLLIFAHSGQIERAAIPSFIANDEVAELGIVYRMTRMDDDFAFSSHREYALQWLIQHGPLADASSGFHPLS